MVSAFSFDVTTNSLQKLSSVYFNLFHIHNNNNFLVEIKEISNLNWWIYNMNNNNNYFEDL